MKKYRVLTVWISLLLCCTPALAQDSWSAVSDRWEKETSYRVDVSGTDAKGAFELTYVYSPGEVLLKRKDDSGESSFLYDEDLRAGKVLANRLGVAYMYKLDNPHLPEYFSRSLFTHYVEKAEKAGSPQVTAVEGGTEYEFSTREGKLTFTVGPEGELIRLVEQKDESQTLMEFANLSPDTGPVLEEFKRSAGLR